MMKLVRYLALALLWMLGAGIAAADQYVLDPHSRRWLFDEKREVPFNKPRYPGACRLYLENLRYFARRGLPMGCGLPVAPHLASVIRPMQWLKLDPNTIWINPYENDIAWLTEEMFIGAPRPEMNDSASPPVPYRLLLSGPGDGDQRDPGAQCRCKPTITENQARCAELKGRASLFSQRRIDIFSPDLNVRYDRLQDEGGIGSGQNLLMINGYPYAEEYDVNATVTLKEINTGSSVFLQPVCSFRFVPDTPARQRRTQ